MTTSLCASLMNFSMQIAHLNREPRPFALCFQAADTSGESAPPFLPPTQWFASVSLPKIAVISRCVVRRMDVRSCPGQNN